MLTHFHVLTFALRFTPRFFEEDISNGRPTLTEAGKEALDGEAKRSGPDDEETPSK